MQSVAAVVGKGVGAIVGDGVGEGVGEGVGTDLHRHGVPVEQGFVASHVECAGQVQYPGG